MNSKGSCEECRTGNIPPTGAQSIGDPVAIGTAVGRGYDQTEHRFSQCKSCGSVWVTYEDSGAGGHGTFHKRLTAGLF
jgi:hypothetical protein